ncbi:MAG: NAD(P)H-dependent flavin oxidoreductase [Bacteroidota bacterium]
MQNPVTSLLGIKYPLVQAGMVWCSGWELASAVSDAGGLGLLGAGSMKPDILEHHVKMVKKNTSKPFGVNIPLLYPFTDDFIEIIIREKVKIVFTSAGNPSKYITRMKDEGVTVFHVVPGTRFAEKAIKAGVDGLVAEGFEAGGHNGKDETTTLVLVPLIRKLTTKPLLAAGGIATGRAMLAAMALGADGVQIGSRFAVSCESSAHINFKNRILEINEGDTRLYFRKIAPVRLALNDFSQKAGEMEEAGASREDLLKFLGRGRSKMAIFEGDLDEGEIEIGQVASQIKAIQPAGEILKDIINEFVIAREELTSDGKYSF